MKTKTIIRPLHEKDRFFVDVKTDDILLLVLPHLDLGNNFTDEHLFNAIYEALTPEQLETIYNQTFDVVKINAPLNYGRLKQIYNGFDFSCFFSDIWEKIVYCEYSNQLVKKEEIYS